MKKLLHFTAEWCGPCKKIKPLVEEYIDENKGIKYIQINVDDDLDSVKQYNIMSIPTLISLDDYNQIIKRHTGIITKEQIDSLFN